MQRIRPTMTSARRPWVFAAAMTVLVASLPGTAPTALDDHALTTDLTVHGLAASEVGFFLLNTPGTFFLSEAGDPKRPGRGRWEYG